ncbi:MAG: Cys-Gln thioester bond-forming surface protein [Actinoplanes sp.]
MFEQRGRRWARIALAAVAGGALAFGVAGTAAAAPATGVAKAVEGTEVTLKLDGKKRTTSALALKIDGKLVPAFCIDYHTNVKLDGKYEEGTWDKSEVQNLGKVQWVLTHGYPNADSAALLAAAGVQTKIGKKQLDTLLYFGTQTAVWHFSDGIELGAWENGLQARNQYEVITKVRDYLVKNATDQPEPRAELAVDPASATATVGGKAGPFTVKGPAGDITVAATGGQAVDAEGKPVTTTTNGGQFWLAAESAGTVTVTLTAQDSVSFGRVFLFTGAKKAQKLILGGSTGATITATAAASFSVASSPTPSASATPTASPSPTTPEATPSASESPASPAPSTSPASNGGALPLTGSPIAAAATAGLLLLAAGAVAVLVVRRRKVRFTA